MEPQRSYLEFSPRCRPGHRFPGATIPFDVRNTASRRQHLRAYFAFMRPEAAQIQNEYGKRATQLACEQLYDRGKRAIPTPFFECLVDRVMWQIWFQPLSDRPVWPWGQTFSMNLFEGENPNRVFAQYCEVRRAQEAQTTAASTTIPSSAVSSSATAPNPNDEFIIYDEAPIDGIPNSSGPFEAETPWYLPAEFICEDLAAINQLVPTGVIKFNATSKCVVLVPGEGVHPDNEELLRVWQIVQEWLTLVGQAKVITLLEHLSGVLGN